MDPLLSVQDLEVSFFKKGGVVRAIRGLSYIIHRGETLGIVGESGCGKTVTSLAILRLLETHAAITGGKVVFDGTDLVGLPEGEMCRVRGGRIAMIFQEPMTAFNPVRTVGDQIAEQLIYHKAELSKKERQTRVIELLALTGIPAPARRAQQFPHELSGGMRQRAMIAMALSCGPALLIADEPTTALDVTIQAQILDLLQGLQEKFHMAIQFITHDMGVISEMADRIVVMYAGLIVETAASEALFARPRHPYTVGLLASIPKLIGGGRVLKTIEGTVPSLTHLPKGCPFQNRCPRVLERCREEDVMLTEVGAHHKLACFNPY